MYGSLIQKTKHRHPAVFLFFCVGRSGIEPGTVSLKGKREGKMRVISSYLSHVKGVVTWKISPPSTIISHTDFSVAFLIKN